MKKINFLGFLFCSALAYVFLCSRSTGAGFNGLGDLTNSPLSTGTCANCHSGGNFGTSVTITLRDQTNNPVNSYIPGQSYILEFDVNNSIGTAGGFGGQVVALTNTNSNAGTMGSIISSNTRLVTIAGRSYMEHNSVSPSGLFRVNWTAPTTGTGTVSIYASGLTVNGTGNTIGDQTVSSSIQITEQIVTAIAYGQSTYCQDAANPLPTISGITGGIFTAAAGLSLNLNTGQINLSASTPGNYTVNYNHSGGSTSTSVTITAVDVATLSYGPNTNLCISQTNTVSPIITGVQTGSFISSPAGLSINGNGVISPSASTAGSYTVSYTTSGLCPSTVSSNIRILATDTASFSYGFNPNFCNSQSIPAVPIVSGPSTGIFSAGAGLVLDSITGEILPFSSLPGNYSVIYTTTGICPVIISENIQIIGSDFAEISYSNNNPVFDLTISDSLYLFNCTSPIPAPLISGTQGGYFSTNEPNVMIDSLTGEIFLPIGNLNFGPSPFIYQTQGQCPTVDTFWVSSFCPTQVENNAKDFFSVYPNPSTEGRFVLQNLITDQFEENTEILVFDATGKLFFEKTFVQATNTIELDLSHLIHGFYYVHLIQKAKSAVIQVVILP